MKDVASTFVHSYNSGQKQFNIDCKDKVMPKNFINLTNVAGSKLLKEWLGIHYEGNVYYDSNHCPAQILRNCVHPEVGQQVLLNALKS